MVTSAVYLERKLAGLCTRCGEKPAADGANECALHLAARRASQSVAKRKRRRARRRRKLCTECGRKAKGATCVRCAAAWKIRHASATVSSTVSHRSAAIAARTVVDADNRTRYHGQERRGGMERKVVDLQDIDEVIKLAIRSRAGYVIATADDMIPKAERKAAVDVVLGVLDHAKRFIEAVFQRNRFESEGFHGD